MFCQSVVTIYSVKLIFLWDFPLKISFLRCFLKSIRYFWDPHRCCLDSFFIFVFFFSVNFMQHIVCIIRSKTIFMPPINPIERDDAMNIRVTHTFYAWIRLTYFSVQRMLPPTKRFICLSVCVRVCMCAFWCIENGITHKSRENKENDIFICYRL